MNTLSEPIENFIELVRDSHNVVSSEFFDIWSNASVIPSWRDLTSILMHNSVPMVLPMPLLITKIQESSEYLNCHPMSILDAFLFYGGLPSEGSHWLEYQDDGDVELLFKTTVAWLRNNPHRHVAELTFLKFATCFGQMQVWRVHASEYRPSKEEWYKSLEALHIANDVQLSDIEHCIHDMPLDTLLLKLCTLPTPPKNLIQVIGDKPGVYLTLLFDGHLKNDQDRHFRAQLIWNNMSYSSLDAWAYTQWRTPSATFEESLLKYSQKEKVGPHKEWAQQWWCASVLGSSWEQMRELVANVYSGALEQESFDAPSQAFEH